MKATNFKDKILYNEDVGLRDDKINLKVYGTKEYFFNVYKYNIAFNIQHEDDFLFYLLFRFYYDFTNVYYETFDIEFNYTLPGEIFSKNNIPSVSKEFKVITSEFLNLQTKLFLIQIINLFDETSVIEPVSGLLIDHFYLDLFKKLFIILGVDLDNISHLNYGEFISKIFDNTILNTLNNINYIKIKEGYRYNYDFFRRFTQRIYNKIVLGFIDLINLEFIIGDLKKVIE